MQRDLHAFQNKLDTYKYVLPAYRYKEISEHVHNCLTSLGNMLLIDRVSQESGYGSQYRDLMCGQKLRKGKDGVLSRSKRAYRPTGEGWERQFDESKNLNPPCYIKPTSCITGLAPPAAFTQQQKLFAASKRA
jgi:hypothetical protein